MWAARSAVQALWAGASRPQSGTVHSPSSVTILLGLLLHALALFYGLIQVVRGSGERRDSFLLLLLWFAVPLILQSRSTAPVQPHYSVLFYPVQFLLIAAMVVDVLSRISVPKLRLFGRRLSVLSLLLTVALLIWGGWQTLESV